MSVADDIMVSELDAVLLALIFIRTLRRGAADSRMAMMAPDVDDR